MGRGDKKTKRGKIFKGSFGVSRKRKSGNVITQSKNIATTVDKVKKVESAEKNENVEATKTKKTTTKKATTTKKPKKDASTEQKESE